METTCQICARNIKANTGLIAHHGYQRPGWGMQSASCYGARELPFEQSRDALGNYLGMVKDVLEAESAKLSKITTVPPKTITTEARYLHPSETFTRPADFDKDNYYGSMSGTYENAYRNLVHDAERNIKELQREVERLETRYNSWAGVRG